MSPSALAKAEHLAYVCTIFFAVCLLAEGHVISTNVTWNREISRIVYARCATCHRSGSSAFSLMGYQEASPWANAIKQDVLQQKMPPWGAVKGFGNFRNDEALTQEEIGLIDNWVDGGAPEGNPDDLPTRPNIPPVAIAGHRAGEIVASGEYRFQRPFTLDGFRAQNLPNHSSAQITIEFPDGRIEPLVWLYDYTAQCDHPFLLRTPLSLPSGTLIHGLPVGSSLIVLPVTSEH